MAQYDGGLICVSLTPERVNYLRPGAMAANNSRAIHCLGAYVVLCDSLKTGAGFDHKTGRTAVVLKRR